MAKLSKLIFILSDKKEVSLSDVDALKLYNELDKIFGTKTPVSVGTRTSLDSDTISIFSDTISIPSSINQRPHDWDGSSVKPNYTGAWGGTAVLQS
jgi:hypothetical protein